MRNLTLIFAFLFIGWSVSASVNSKPATTNFYNYNDSFIFVEGGVEFAVYPNGEFDFYYNPEFRRGNSVHFSTPNVNISYNGGYNYDPYVQYDDYGAVIQIENVPVYYDYYGRIIQAGNIYLSYNNFGRLARVGNLHVHYNNHHHITHYSGYINHYNRRYVYRPWHDYYRRPNVNVSIVFGRPYRAYYEPQRISYNKYVTVYNNYYSKNNRRKNFYRPSQKVRSYNHGRRTSSKRNIAYVNNSNDYNRAATRESVSRDRVYSERNKSSRVKSARNTRDIVNNRSPRTYSERNERSTDSRGRSSKIGNSTQKRQSTVRERSIRSPQKQNSSVRSRTENRTSNRVDRPTQVSRDRSIQNKTNTRIKRSSPVTRGMTIEKSTRSSERNAAVKRPTRQSSSSVRTRTNSGSSRSQSVRTKKSSGSRSSARNVNNRL